MHTDRAQNFGDDGGGEAGGGGASVQTTKNQAPESHL